MATGMRIWIGLAALGSLGIGAWLLPPDAPARDEGVDIAPAETRARDLRREIRRSHDILQKIRWADSLTALTLSTAVDGLATGGAPQATQAGTLDSVRVRIADELRRADITEARAVLGFFVQPRGFAGLEGTPRDVRTPLELYMGQADGRAYCYRVLVTPSSVSPNNGMVRRVSWTEYDASSNILGPCRVVARYGLPGPAVRAWLERGALDFAEEPVYGTARLLGRVNGPANWPFGRAVPSWAENLEMEQCLAGYAEACETVALHPLNRKNELEDDLLSVVERSPVSGLGQVVFRSPFGSADDYLLADLAADFGPDRFAAFWTSDQDVSRAFQSAFGLSLGEWMVSWTGEHFGHTAAGPALSAGAASGTFLLLTLCALVAGAWARRRRVA